MKYIAVLSALILGMGIALALSAEEEPTRRYMLTHGKSQGQFALDVVREHKGRRARRLRHRDIVAVDLTDAELAKLRQHPLFKHARIEPDPPRFLQATNSEEIIP